MRPPKRVESSTQQSAGRALGDEPASICPHLMRSGLVSERHLFVDDYEVTRSIGLTRQVHQPTGHPASPVLKPDTPWESRVSAVISPLLLWI